MRVFLTSLVLVLMAFGAGVIFRDDDGIVAADAAYRAYLVSTARDGLSADSPTPEGPTDLPPIPEGWPTTLELGHSDSPGGASATADRGLAFRYQYLAGGANTGNGWATWAPDGSFVADYIAESEAAGVIPVFSYYMVRHSLPGADHPEVEGVRENLRDAGTMLALFEDLELFFKRASTTDGLVVLHFEPDLWGNLHQLAEGDDASKAPVAVGATGHPDLEGLPNTAAGLARALMRLRDLHAPDVLLAYHMSFWGTGVDPIYSDPSSSELERLASRSVEFYTSLSANFDLTFAEMSDRDAGFKQHVYGDGGASWWDEDDFGRHAAFLREFAIGSGLRTVLWQIPQGNTVMRAMNNTWNHYQDNKVEWLLGDGELSRLRPYVDAGVIGLLFGRGADGATCACDAAGDGITNPDPLNGNLRYSLSADDDGGYFKERVGAFIGQPPVVLP